MLFLLIPLLLIILEAVFAAGETGLISIEKIMVTKAQKENKKWADRANNFLSAPERFFSTISVCENFIIVVASTLFAKFFIDFMGDNGIFCSILILSILSLTIGQFIPKSIALSKPVRTMTALSGVIYYIQIIMYPIVYFYAIISKSIAHLFKGRATSGSMDRLDIIYAITEYEEKASRLAARLFDFSKRTVAEVMIPLEAVFSCKKGSELKVLSRKHGRIYTRIPVYEGKRDNIIGVFNIKDYFYTNKITLRKPFFVNTNERCMSIFSVMKQKGRHMAIIRDNDDHIVGIVALEDLIEELVGEIRDEK